MTVGICHDDHVAPSIRQTLAITSPTIGGRSLGYAELTQHKHTQSGNYAHRQNVNISVYFIHHYAVSTVAVISHRVA
jgi:hypothetical protein